MSAPGTVDEGGISPRRPITVRVPWTRNIQRHGAGAGTVPYRKLDGEMVLLDGGVSSSTTDCTPSMSEFRIVKNICTQNSSDGSILDCYQPLESVFETIASTVVV